MPEQVKPCHFIIQYDVQTPPTSSQIASLLQKGSQAEKIDALKTLILMILQDEHFPRMIMNVVQHALRVDSKQMKKLLLLYFESIEKTNPDGTIKDQMVLLCNALRNDLLSPNEFIRARTLRLVSKMRYREMMDTLLQPALECLTHRHPYVRRNAVMCVYSIFLKFGDDLMPNIVSVIDELLSNETDLSTRRNALLFLFEAAPDQAMKYLNSVLLDQEDSNSMFGASADILQLVVLDEMKKVCKANPLEKGKYMKSIFSLATSTKSQSVLFQCAQTIQQLTRSPSAIKLAISSYIKLITDRSSDPNVKLIVLQKLTGLKKSFSRLLQDQAMDILRVLNDNSDQIRKCSLNLVLDLISPRNIQEITRILKKQLVGIQNQKEEHVYQELLIQALHRCATSYPQITGRLGLVDVLIDCCLLQAVTAEQVASFVQQLLVTYQSFREGILEKLHKIFFMIQSSQVYRSVLWVLSEFSSSPQHSIKIILESVGEGPYINKRQSFDHYQAVGQQQTLHRTVVLPDGTYGVQIVQTSHFSSNQHTSGLRKLLTEVEEVDFFLVTSIALSLTKLLFRLDQEKQASLKTEILLVLCRLVQLRTYPKKSRCDQSYVEVPFSIDPDNFQRIVQCIQAITGQIDHQWLTIGKNLYVPSSAIKDYYQQKPESTHIDPDQLIGIKQLRGRQGLNDIDILEDDPFRMSFTNLDDYGAPSKRIQPLTGFGDPVYAECSIKLHHYDIVLQFTVINQSKQTLQNLTFELASQGDLKLVERPQQCSIAPYHQVSMKATVKVMSTQAGIIFGNLTYDSSRGGTLQVLQLNPIQLDTIEYLNPATCSQVEFQKMWQQFKWETPINVSATSFNLYQYAMQIKNFTNMEIITPEGIMKNNQDFLVCNFYALSQFSENALMNLSLERKREGISGMIRIRAKSEGMAKCLGEKFMELQQIIQDQWNCLRNAAVVFFQWKNREIFWKDSL